MTVKQVVVNGKKLLIFEGALRSVVSENDFCHAVVYNDEPCDIDFSSFVETDGDLKLRTWTLDQTPAELLATAREVELQKVIPYWGIKQRIRDNYELLLNSLEQIGIDTEPYPEFQR